MPDRTPGFLTFLIYINKSMNKFFLPVAHSSSSEQIIFTLNLFAGIGMGYWSIVNFLSLFLGKCGMTKNKLISVINIPETFLISRSQS